MLQIVYVGIGGFIGACLRYLISSYLPKIADFPFGTLLVNVLGGLFIGIVMELSLSTDVIPPNLRLFLTTGVLGGLTTFSTFSYETIAMFNDGSYLIGILNVGLNLILSLGGVVAGTSIIRAMI